MLLRVFKQQLPLNRSFRTSCSPSPFPPPSFFVPGWLFYRLFTGVRRSFSSFGTHEGVESQNGRKTERERERERKKKGRRKVVRGPTKIFVIMRSRGIFFFPLFTRKLRERESWRKSRRLIDAMEITTGTKGEKGEEEGRERAIRSSVFSFALETSNLFIASYSECAKYCSKYLPGLMTPWELYPSLEYRWNGEENLCEIVMINASHPDTLCN